MANPAERRNRDCLAMFKVMNAQVPLTEQLVPAFASMATLLYNSLPTQPSGYSPHQLIFNDGPFRPNLPLTPFCGKLPEESFGQYCSRFARLKNIFFFIQKIHVERNRVKQKSLQKYTNRFQKGDFVLLQRKSVGNRIGAKLRQRCYQTPFIVKKVLQKSCIIIPYEPETLREHSLKRHGRRFTPKQLLVSMTRLKIIQNPLPFLDIGISQRQLLKLADIFKPISVKRVRVILTDPPVSCENVDLQDFFKLMSTPGLALTDHQKAFLSSQVKSLQNVELFVKNPGHHRFHNQILSLFTNEHLIQLKSSIHATCSYGDTEDFIKFHNKLEPATPGSNISWRRRRLLYNEKKLDPPSPNKEISGPSSSDLLGGGSSWDRGG